MKSLAKIESPEDLTVGQRLMSKYGRVYTFLGCKNGSYKVEIAPGKKPESYDWETFVNYFQVRA